VSGRDAKRVERNDGADRDAKGFFLFPQALVVTRIGSY